MEANKTDTATTDGKWTGRKSVVEFYTSLVGLFASSVTLTVTLAGTLLFRPQVAEPEVVRHVISLPFWETLTLQLVDEINASTSMGAAPGSGPSIDAEALRRALAASQQSGSDTLMVSRPDPMILLGAVGLAAGVLVVSLALFFRSRR